MATDLKNRPGSEEIDDEPLFDNDTPQAVYDDEFEKIIGRMKQGDADDRANGNDRGASSPEELQEQEDAGIDSAGNSNDKEAAALANKTSEAADNTNQDDSFYTGGPQAKRSLRGRALTRRNAVIVSIVTTLAAGTAGLTVQAPNLLINQLKEMLLGRISSVQMHQSRQYRQKKLGKLKNYLSKDGRLGQKIISEMEASGYQFKFDPNDKNAIIGIVHPNGTGIIGDGIGDHIDGFMETKHPLRTARWKTKAMNAFYTKFGVSRTSVVDVNKARAGPDGKVDAEKIVNREAANDILEGDDGLTLENGKSTDPKKKADEAVFDEADSEISDQVKADRAKVLAGETLTEGSTGKILSDAANGVTEDVVNLAEGAATSGGVGSKLFSALKSLGPTDIADKVCTVRNRTQGIATLGRASRSIKLIRYMMLFVNAADDTRRGKGSSKLVSALMKRTTATDKNGVSIGGSPGFAYMMKGKFSKSRNNAVRSSVAVDGKLTGVLAGINTSFDKIPGMGVSCPVVQNPIAQVGLGVASVVAGFFTAGGDEVAIQAGEQAAQATIKDYLKSYIEELSLKEIAKGAAKSAIAGLSFEGIMTLTEMYVQKSLNLPFTGQEKGGQLGDILVAGAGTANKQRSLAAGMVPATTQEYASAENEYIAWNNNQLKQRSLVQRMFASDDTHSLLFNTALAVPSGVQEFASQPVNKTVSLISSILSPAKASQSIAKMLSPKVAAATDDEISFDEFEIASGSSKGTKLATDPAGNLQVIMRPDIEAIDPETNTSALIASGDIDPQTFQPKSDAFQDHISDCVDATDILTKIEGDDPNDCLAKKQKTKQFKAHLAYLDMRDSVEAEFLPEDINSGTETAPAANSISTTSAQTSLATPSTSAANIGQTSIIPGTGDKRIATSILPQLTAMLEGARKDGIELLPISSGWRDPEKQIALRKQNCPDWRISPASDCSPPTAKPGTSEHEKGQAVDFGNMCYPNGTTCPGNSRWNWLRANAAKYGFFPLKSEAWHWSTTGT